LVRPKIPREEGHYDLPQSAFLHLGFVSFVAPKSLLFSRQVGSCHVTQGAIRKEGSMTMLRLLHKATFCGKLAFVEQANAHLTARVFTLDTSEARLLLVFHAAILLTRLLSILGG